MLVQQFLEESAARRPDKIALVQKGVRLTYAELDQQANALANALRAQGLRRGDRVALFLPNCVEAVIGVFAILKAGGVFLMINQTTKHDKLMYVLNNCRASAIIATGRSAGIVASLLPLTPSLKTVVLTSSPAKPVQGLQYLSFEEALRGHSRQRPAVECIDLDLACLIYTSGTTGEPKGIMSTHASVCFAAESIINFLGNREDDVVIDALPLSFDYGLYQILMVARFGGTLILESGFTFPAAVLKQMETERVTGFPGVPTMFALLLKLDTSRYDLSSLRYMTNTGAALPVEHIRQLQEKFPQVTFFSMYGLSETKRTLYLPPDQLEARPGSVGIAIPGTEVWIEDEGGRRLGPDQVGELVVRGRHVMSGYWEDPVATAERYRAGPIPGERLCYTGDLFKMDAGGYMYFVSRKDDIIKSRGEKVAPREVETVICSLAGVREAAVIGVADPVLGQAIKAFVAVDDPSIDRAAVLAHCRANLEDIMVPQQIELLDELPRTASGKVQKSRLQPAGD